MEEDEFTFIEEQVKHKKSNKVLRIVKKLGLTVIMAAVFGAISALSFYFVYGLFPEKNNSRPMPTYIVNKEETSPAGNSTMPPGNNNYKEKSNEDRLNVYERRYANIAAFCAEQNEMLVIVSDTEDDTDYFEGSVEYETSYGGIIISKDNNYIYVLTEGSSDDKSSNYKIMLSDGTKLDAAYQAADTATGFMILSADISDISQSSRKSIKTAKIGTSSDIKKGDMVFAVGEPQGTMYSIAYGYICSDVTRKYLLDRSVTVFDTNMNFTTDASGYVINSDKEVIGIISGSFFDNTSESGCFLGITPLMGLINQLVSGSDRAEAGIILQDIKKEYLDSRGLDNGIYVQDINYGAKVLQEGLAVGDVIISVNGKDVGSVEDYTAILESCSVGEEISFDIYRDYAQDDKYKTITVELGKGS